MRILFIGGPPDGIWNDKWRDRATEIGEALERHGHELLVCSSYERAADRWVLDGFVNSGKSDGKARRIHLYPPKSPETIREDWERLFTQLGLHAPVHYTPVPGPPADPTVGGESLRDAYLLAQLEALKGCDAVVACGGKPSSSASSSLSIATARSLPILPYMLDRDSNSASAQIYREQHGALASTLEPVQLELLLKDEGLSACGELLGRLQRQGSPPERGTYVFISHAWGRPEHTDLVEIELRRHGIKLFRDERNIQPGADLPVVINRALDNCTHFIGLWCDAYASSPHCYDELHRVVERNRQQATGARLPLTRILMLRHDDTRLVWKALREKDTNILHPRIQGRHHLRSVLHSFLGLAPPSFS